MGSELQIVDTPSQDKENVFDGMDNAVTQIREQCEFYFSDANILKDQFMLNQVKSSTDGWVKLGIIEKFKKVQRLTQDHSVVVHALSMSSKLELSEDGLSVRRRDPLPSWDPSVYHRTIILTDLPEDVELNHAKVTELFTLFATDIGWYQQGNLEMGSAAETFVVENIQQHQLRWLDHVLRMPEHRLSRLVLSSVAS
ncbi:hypothetical protein T265_06691 [Opisthorchis viverrini]|uniref:HTH La-type RNA-binding domain-containing protein n=1 Tax=Opisthorchis viverrini TaxID=6198 RepID=A0A074ZFH3_OPIVI|nr:hypothetical protein T265_06691 [Opisthorchis viverrini]KER25938.1 hypothetical protein T265_06691 [Opisthorchis viverrini]